MKKKITIILIGGLVSCLIGGCAGETKKAATDDTAVVQDEQYETESVEEKAEVTVEEESGTETEVSGQVSEESTAESPEAEGTEENSEAEGTADDELLTEIEIGEDGSVDGQEFPIILQDALDHDKSEEYGVNSVSCFDLDTYLDENGEIPDDWTYESTEGTEYSGRWAFPVVTPCRFFTGLELNDRTDREEWFSSDDSETGVFISMFIYSGLNVYNDTLSYVGETYDDPDMPVTTLKCTANTGDGTTDVLEERSVSYVSWDDSEEQEEYVMYSYYFNIGNFSVCVCWNSDDPLTEEEVQLIVDNISLTTGLER